MRVPHALGIFLLFLAVQASAQKELQLPQAERGWYVSGAVREITIDQPMSMSLGRYNLYTPAISVGYRLLPYVWPQLDLSYTSMNLEKNPSKIRYSGTSIVDTFEKINYGMIQLQFKISPFRSEKMIRPYIAPIFLWRPYTLEGVKFIREASSNAIIGRNRIIDKGSLYYFSAGVGLQTRVWRQFEIFFEVNRSMSWDEKRSAKTLWGGAGFYYSFNGGINYHFGRNSAVGAASL